MLTQTEAIAVFASTTISYTYDPLNRLTEADYSSGELFTYQYSAVGNRITMTQKITTTTFTTTYEYDDANRLTEVDGVTYTWDDRGNLLNDGVFTYTYDAAGRMVRAEDLTNTLVYTYSADGLRVAEQVSGTASVTTTTFVWDVASPLAQVLRTSDGASYVHGLDLLAEWRDGAWAYPLGDALGSVRQWVEQWGRGLLRWLHAVRDPDVDGGRCEQQLGLHRQILGYLP